MNRFFDMPCDLKMMSPLNLAYIGDAVYDILVRERLVCIANRPVNKLHNNAAKIVNAKFQAKAVVHLMPEFTEKEVNIFKKGRNAHTNHKAKNASEGDYHYATGLEAVFGYLYLDGQLERLKELFDKIIEFKSENIQ